MDLTSEIAEGVEERDVRIFGLTGEKRREAGKKGARTAFMEGKAQAEASEKNERAWKIFFIIGGSLVVLGVGLGAGSVCFVIFPTEKKR